MYSIYAPNLPNTVKTTHIDQKSSGSRMIHVVINTNNRDFSSFQHIQRHRRHELNSLNLDATDQSKGRDTTTTAHETHSSNCI
jgi:hypothetical protein